MGSLGGVLGGLGPISVGLEPVWGGLWRVFWDLFRIKSRTEQQRDAGVKTGTRKQQREAKRNKYTQREAKNEEQEKSCRAILSGIVLTTSCQPHKCNALPVPCSDRFFFGPGGLFGSLWGPLVGSWLVLWPSGALLARLGALLASLGPLLGRSLSVFGDCRQ